MLQSEIYKKVSEDLGIPLEKVKEYDKQMWNFVKVSLNTPTFEVLEIPALGSFKITKMKMRHTLRVQLIRLKRLKAKRDRYPDNEKLKKDTEIYTNLFWNLWRLHRKCNYNK